MRGWILLADELRDLEVLGAPQRMATTKDYVSRPAAFARDIPKIMNLSRSYAYQSTGYYASLLAEARGHRVIPTVETVLDLATKDGYAQSLPELEAALNRDLSKQEGERPQKILVCLGRTDIECCTTFARLLFDWYRAPILSATLSAETNAGGVWTRITSLALVPLHKLSETEAGIFSEAHADYVRRAWRTPKQKVPARYSIAVLHDPEEQLPPSGFQTLKHWARIAEKQGVEVEPISKRDLSRLAEFDALFIRETTSIRNHTYRFARRAAAEGMPVIDDPISMIRCTNKVYLWERLTVAEIPVPDTIVLRKTSALEEIGDVLGYPVVIKIPDGSFSRGVKKAANIAELKSVTADFLGQTDLLLAQRYMPTDYDWRVGVLGGEPLFVTQYKMAKGHWQIVKHKADGSATEGGFKTYSLDNAPSEVIDIAVRAARLIGNGLYGVDLKETPDGPVVIEINDNPNLDHGVEDVEAKADLWMRLTRWFIDQLQE